VARQGGRYAQRARRPQPDRGDFGAEHVTREVNGGLIRYANRRGDCSGRPTSIGLAAELELLAPVLQRQRHTPPELPLLVQV